MSNRETEKVIGVEDLENFPFKTSQEFKEANMEGIAQPGIPRKVALLWAQNGIYAPSALGIQTVLLMLLPFIAALGFIIWIIFSKSWLMLLAVPVLPIALFVFHPSAAKIFGIIRSGLIGSCFIGLVYAFMTSRAGLLALCLTLVVIWYGEQDVYKKAVNNLTKAVSEHEDLLCILWQGKALNITFFNGNQYSVDGKIENGQIVVYENN